MSTHGGPPSGLDGLRRRGVRVRPGPDGALLIALPEAGEDLARWSLEARGLPVTRAGAGLLVVAAGPERPEQIELALRLALCPELICLDVDGTIVDNTMSLLATIRATLVELTGRSMAAAELLAARRAGRWASDEEFVAEMCSRRGHDIPTTEVARVMDSLYFAGPEHPGFAELEHVMMRAGLLPWLADRFALALVTSRSRKKLAAIRSRLALPDGVVIVCGDDLTRDKPEPEGIERALALTSCRHAWMLGDREDDMIAARRAGALPIGVGPRRAQLEAVGAAMVLADINELKRLLFELGAPEPPV